METIYRKVKFIYRFPKRGGIYFSDKGLVFFNDNTKHFENIKLHHREYPEWWLEEFPDPTAQLQADKEELVSFLENLSHNVFWKGRTLDSRDKLKIKTLIQKHKQ